MKRGYSDLAGQEKEKWLDGENLFGSRKGKGITIDS